jgi:hypothetical protein
MHVLDKGVEIVFYEGITHVHSLHLYGGGKILRFRAQRKQDTYG